MSPVSRRSLPYRLLAHARKIAVPAMLLSLTAGGVGVSATAHTAECSQGGGTPTGVCPATGPAVDNLPHRGQPPSGISNQQWRGATAAATFWDNEGINTTRNDPRHLVMQGESGFPGQGWPGNPSANTRGWYRFETGSSWCLKRYYITYRGVFQDRSFRVEHPEESPRM